MGYKEQYEQYITFDKIRSDEGVTRCPFHEGDETPSFSANLSTGLWQCFGCGAKGNFKQFEERFKNRTENVQTELSEIPIKTVNEYHNTLLTNGIVLDYLLHNRGWSEDVIKNHKIGWNGYRVTIPIKNKNGDYVNIRCYDALHKFDPSEKMISWKRNMGGVNLWPIHIVEDADEIYLFEGEPDTILGLSLGLQAATLTSGVAAIANNIHKFANYFKGKKVYLIYDTDQAGKKASLNVSRILSKIADVYNVDLSPTNDFTDYIVKNNSFKDFLDLKNNTDLFEDIKSVVNLDDEPILIDLSKAGYPDNYLKHIMVKSIVSGKDLIPYLIPKNIILRCNVNHTFCKICPLAIYGGESEHTIDNLNPLILELIGTSNKGMMLVLKDHFSVPKRCSSFDVNIVNTQNIEELRLIPEFTYTDINSLEEYVVRQAYYCGSGIKSNEIYSFKGTTLPHPRSQHVTHMFNDADTVADAITNFKLQDGDKELLTIFHSNYIENKVDHILDDLTYNITEIYQRKDLLLSIILTFMSPVSFNFLGKQVKKGWIESLIVSDTRCGKSETIERFIQHVKLGEIATGENVTLAGLIGGIQQIGNRFMISWGKIPLNDRRILIIDEASSLEKEEIEKLSGVRSSGIAEITKIQAERTFARTRLIWLSNPRSNRPIKSYDLGITTVKELIGKPEDIARFDFVLIMSTDEVDERIINKAKHKTVKHVYNSEAFHKLILWMWSRKNQNIKFDKGVEEYILKQTLLIGDKYRSDIPLVDTADLRLKISRISVAIAGLTFSSNDCENLIVKKEHAEYACSFLMNIYDKEVCGYDIYADRNRQETYLKDEKEIIDQLTVHGKQFVECLASAQYLRLGDFEDFGNMERSEAKDLISFLVTRRAISRRHTFYIKNPPFISLLKRILLDRNTIYGEQQNEEI